jgi:hypothetical protein
MTLSSHIQHLRSRGYKITKIYLRARPRRPLSTAPVEVAPDLCAEYHTDYIIETEGPKRRRKSRAKAKTIETS